MKSIQIFSLVLGMGLLASCGKDEKKKVENTYHAPDLQSEWAGGCEAAGFLPLSASVGMSFDSLAFGRTLYLSIDNGCKVRDVEISYHGEYATSEPNDQQKAIKAVPINLSYKSVSVKALTEEGVKALSGVNFCGVNSWTVNAAVDLTAMSTAATCFLLDLPQVQYDIVSTDGGILRFGITGVQNAPVKPEERPTELKGLTLNEK